MFALPPSFAKFENYILLAIAMVSVNIASAFAKEVIGSIDALTMAFIRLTFGFILLVGFTLPGAKQRFSNRTKHEWLSLVGVALTIVGMYVFFYLSLKTIALGMSATIQFLGPLMVGVFGIRRIRDFAWVALAAVGVVLLGGSMQLSDWVGIVYALLAGASWLGYILGGAHVKNMWAGTTVVATACLIGMVTLAPYAIQHNGSKLIQPNILGLGVLIAITGTAIPMVLQLHVLKTIDTSVYGILSSFEPAFAVLAGFFIIGEVITFTQWLAVACVIIAAIGITVQKTPRVLVGSDEEIDHDIDEEDWIVPRMQTPLTPLLARPLAMSAEVDQFAQDEFDDPKQPTTTQPEQDDPKQPTTTQPEQDDPTS